MRTLFLLAILSILVAIAVKKPDQTALEAAQELGAKVQDNIPDIPSITGNANEDFTSLEKQVSKALEDVKARSSGYGKDKVVEKTKKPKKASPTETSKPKSATVRTAEASSSWGRDTLPRPSATDLPDLPTAPVDPVEVGGLEDDMPSSGRSSPRQTAGEDYGEVKAFYENASRLLAEIK
ncbi:MAG TPA: hypothetical protein QF509_00655 [Rhodospirillales bacterium]|jgi:hypothetical protein|nr:hypothetical protein [Rhodospirillales bacterium]